MGRGPVRLAELAARFDGELLGDGEVLVGQVGTLRGAAPGDISFLTNSRYRADLDATRASAVILGAADRDATGLPRIVAGDPYACFARVSAFFNPPEPVVPGIHPSAVVGAEATVAADAAIGAGCIVEPRARVEAGASVGPGCVIGAGALVGAEARLHAHVTVYRDCVIGPRTIVHAGAVIGADGFGFAPSGGQWLKIPQIGRVVIGADVEIGANTTIDRGAIEDTVIEDGVKLDNQVQIGHNCRIGAHSVIAGCTGIAGSTIVGRHCMIGGAAMISGHLSLADGVVIAGGTWVTKSIEAAGTYQSVIPAMEGREWRRTVALLRGLGRMAERLRTLEHWTREKAR